MVLDLVGSWVGFTGLGLRLNCVTSPRLILLLRGYVFYTNKIISFIKSYRSHNST